MRDKVLAAIVAMATFGVVNGAIVGVGLVVAEPAGTSVFADAAPRVKPAAVAVAAVPTLSPGAFPAR